MKILGKFEIVRKLCYYYYFSKDFLNLRHICSQLKCSSMQYAPLKMRMKNFTFAITTENRQESLLLPTSFVLSNFVTYREKRKKNIEISSGFSVV